ncbi:type II secretion system protein [Mucilaginibacter terrae]|uniref:Tfp pilus assembly protein PilV n=1 Tax=Mucilaginibacter terrae TaxID=1955052 RepID=A0ABU3GVF6_9SPHI|nr:hypothetical protein [Mucilaginibacter terrae]MDT3403748.1 Tfp pilus assembly protein PilV [Mucilaginibacter terrae]
MAQLKWKHKFDGSTVVEVIVAMVIIMIVLGLGLTIYSNVMRQSIPARQIRARMIVKKVFMSAQLQPEVTNEQSFGSWHARYEASPYRHNEKLLEVQVVVSDENGNRITESRQLVINKQSK